MKQHAEADTLQFETASITHEGRVRKFNEDSVYANADRGIWVVADGMGGHKDGNVASGMIANTAREIGKSASQAELLADFKNRIAAVNATLLGLSNGDNDQLVGSTVVGLLIQDSKYTCAWAGDSRCYLVRRGKISQVSHDHTEVQELVDKGIISKSEAKTWPRRNVITRAVGADHDLELEFLSGQVETEDCFVLCSDGLTGHVEDAEILSCVTWSPAQEACEKLLALALDRGGKDNVSVIVVCVSKREATNAARPW
jgi:serine/threonine protein phosphatase PrpC